MQANRGMAALLIPKTIFIKGVRRDCVRPLPAQLDVVTRQLAARFSVSRGASAIRLRRLGLIDDGEGLFEP